MSLFEDKAGNIWIGTFNGTIKYDGKTFKPVTQLPPHLTYYFIQDKKGVIWFSANLPDLATKTAKQFLYNYSGNAFTKVIEKGERGDSQIFGKIADRDGKIWFGTMHGVCSYDGKRVRTYRR